MNFVMDADEGGRCGSVVVLFSLRPVLLSLLKGWDADFAQFREEGAQKPKSFVAVKVADQVMQRINVGMNIFIPSNKEQLQPWKPRLKLSYGGAMLFSTQYLCSMVRLLVGRLVS